MLVKERDYFDRIAYIAECAVSNAYEQADNIEDARELIYDGLLHEAVDGSDLAIYTSYHLPVLYHTANEDAWEEFGFNPTAVALKEGGITQLHAYLAYCAIYADVNDIIEDALKEGLGGRGC